jgi:transcriptional regulator with XRE-family HTH domain
MSQLSLSGETGVSTRHLSYVETGRSRPSPSLILTLADALDVPLRERNGLLMAAGHAPQFKETAWGDPDLANARSSVERYLYALDPSPAYAVDRLWRLVVANRCANVLMAGLPEAMREDDGTLNVLKAILHPDGLRPAIRNVDEVAGHLLARLRRQVMLTADAQATALLREVRAFPGIDEGGDQADGSAGGEVFIPVELIYNDTVLTFVSAMTTFGTAVDITLAELSVETLLPADDDTAVALQNLATATHPNDHVEQVSRGTLGKQS